MQIVPKLKRCQDRKGRFISLMPCEVKTVDAVILQDRQIFNY